MNYFPYANALPYTAATNLIKPSLFSGITGGIKWSSILSGAQKTLNVVNQALPLIKQAGPMFNNAKTMFKVMNEFKKVETPVSNNINVNNVSSESKQVIEQSNNSSSSNPNGLTFFQ